MPRGVRDWRSVAAAALLGIVLSNGLAVLALRHVASNQAALINSSCAFWIAWLGMYGRRAAPVSSRTWVGLTLGFAGVAVLVSREGLQCPGPGRLAAARCWSRRSHGRWPPW